MAKYIYDNKEFCSIKSLAQYVGKNEKTITARLRKGMTVEEACNADDLRCSYYKDGDIRKSITQICEEHSKDEFLIYNRLRYGYSINDALNKPKKVTKQGAPIVVNGILYNSISMAIKRLNLEKKESTIRRRLKIGMKPDDAFYFKICYS
ncbi:MAG: hypothetical protein SO160_02130 [Lachnospiraceae bacterium]|nr:hypothetical protein [Lachnospiraceae bacterium]